MHLTASSRRASSEWGISPTGRATRSVFQLRVNSDQKDGAVPYAVFVPPRDRSDVSDSFVGEARGAFVDLFFAERRIGLKKEAMEDAERIRRAWLAKVLPTADDERVAGLLRSRRFVVIEGPPG